MEKDLRIGVYLDYYRSLLTAKQADAVDLYFNHDLSLAEIGENLGITRQAARDAIKRGGDALAGFEASFGLYNKDIAVGRLLEIIDGMEQSPYLDEIKQLIESLQTIV